MFLSAGLTDFDKWRRKFKSVLHASSFALQPVFALLTVGTSGTSKDEVSEAAGAGSVPWQYGGKEIPTFLVFIVSFSPLFHECMIMHYNACFEKYCIYCEIWTHIFFQFLVFLAVCSAVRFPFPLIQWSWWSRSVQRLRYIYRYVYVS